MRTTERLMRIHDGFTLLELLVVLVVGGIVLSIAVPAVNSGLDQSRVQRAASVAAIDVQLAFSMAARQRQPVRITVDVDDRIMRIVDHAEPTRVYSQRFFGSDGEHPVQSVAVSDSEVVVFPGGLADGALAITFGIGDNRRRVVMSRAGQVRVNTP